MKNKYIAIMLAAFVGFCGVHQFYLGNKAKGVWYAIFFWTGVPAFIALIDLVMLAVTSDRNFDYKYNREYEYYRAEHEPLSQAERLHNLFNNNQEQPRERYEPPYKDRQEDFLDLDPVDKGLDLEKLEKLGKLRNEGVLTEDEFQIQKDILLNR